MIRFIITVTACLLLSAGAASSATLYQDRASWSNAVSGAHNIDFEGIAPAGGSANFSTAAGLTIQGVNFVGTEVVNSRISGATNNLGVFDPGANPSRYDWGSGAVLGGPFSGLDFQGTPVGYQGTITATLPANTFAFGTDLMVASNVDPQGNGVTITLADGTKVDILPTSARPMRDFVGYVSSIPIASITFDIDDKFAFPPVFRYGMLDNFSFSTVPPGEVPEPCSLALTIFGGVVLVLRKKFRRNSV